MARIDRENTEGVRGRRTFEEASIHYMHTHSNKPPLESDTYHLKPVMLHIGHLGLEQVLYETLRPFIAGRMAQGIKNKTINLSMSTVRNILNLAATDWRDHNGFMWLAQAPRITCLDLDDQRPPRPLAWSEQRRLLPPLPDHLAEMALFMLNTGLRDQPVCNLQWEWEVPIPQLGCSVFIVPKEFVKGTRKSKRERAVVCNSVAQSIIERQRGKHPTHVFVYRRERVKNKDREPTMPYRPIQTMNNNGWQRARAAAGLGDLHVHDLRHTVGMRLREAGARKETISAIL